MAKTKWDEVTRDYPEAERFSETLKEAIQKYLEKVANIKNLGDVLIRQLRLRTKPAAMKFDDYFASIGMDEAHRRWLPGQEARSSDSAGTRRTNLRAAAQDTSEKVRGRA